MEDLKPIQTDKNGLAKVSDGRYVNPQFATPESTRAMLQNANPQIRVNVPTSVPASTLETRPMALPQTTSTAQTAGASAQGITEGLNQTSLSTLQQEQAMKEQKAQSDVEKQTSTIQSYIDKLMGRGQAQVQAEAEAGISDKAQELTNITNEYNTKALEYRRMEEAVMKEGTLTDVQKNARLREISRVKNTELADIGIRQAVAQNNLKTAQDLVDRKIDLEYGDLKDLITYQQRFLDMNREDLTKAQQNRLNLLLTENNRKYEEGKSIGEFAKQVAANGADASTITRVTNAKSMAEAIQAAGQFAGDVLERQIKQAQLAKLQIDAAAAVAKLGEAPEGTGPVAQAQAKGNIDLISGLASDKYLSSAVGPNTFARTSLFNVFTGGKSNFIAGVEQLSSQLSLDSLIRAKANGATFGALSDSELKILSASASKIGSWAIKDKDGNVVGYKTSEAEFKKELDKINNFAKLDYLIKGGSVEDVGAQQLADGTIWVANSDGSFTQLYP